MGIVQKKKKDLYRSFMYVFNKTNKHTCYLLMLHITWHCSSSEIIAFISFHRNTL